MSEMKQAAAEFLALTTTRRERCEQALDLIIAAVEGAPLYNTEYQEAKDLLGRALEEMWQANVREPFVSGRMGQGAESALDWKIGGPYNLHDLLATYKKMGQLKATSTLEGGIPFSSVNPEMVKAIRQILDAAYPIALAVKDLKAKVVKGRKPAPRNPETVAKEAAKKTCQCCFRAMVVKGGLIVKHGWQEVGNRRQGEYGNAWHTGQCPGSGYEPFEVSCERTKWYAEELRKMQADKQGTLESAMDSTCRPSKLSYEYSEYAPGTRPSKKIGWVEDDGAALDLSRDYYDYSKPPKYMSLLRSHISRLQSEIEMLSLNIADLEKRIAEWKKVS